MITALVYILVFIVVYMIVDVMIYLVSEQGPATLIKTIHQAYSCPDADEAKEIALDALEKIQDWNKNERKMEYKSVWVASRLGKALTLLRRRWKEKWPEELVEEIDSLATDLRKSVPKYFETLARAIIIAVLLALFIRTFVIQAFKIPSGSMIPTLRIGDQLLVTKFTYGMKLPYTSKRILDFRKLRRADIVVFKPPRSVMSSWADHELRVPFTDKVIYSWKTQVDFIKRVVGLPGDKIELKEGVLYINDKPVGLVSDGKFEYESANSSYVRNVQSWLYTETINSHPHDVLYESDNLENENWGPYFVGKGEFFAMGDNRDNSKDSREWTSDPARIEDIRGKALIIHFSWDNISGRPRFKRIGKLLK